MEINLTIEVNGLSKKISREELTKIILNEYLKDILQGFQKKYDVREIGDDKQIKFIQTEELFFIPKVGEYYQVSKILFQVVGVEHSGIPGEVGTIFVKKTNKILQTLELSKF